MHRINIESWFLERAEKLRGGRPNLYETIAPSRTALAVVDMPNNFCADGMPSCVPIARITV